MNIYTLSSVILITVISLSACSGKPYEFKDIKSISNDELFEGKEATFSTNKIKKNNTQPQVIYISSPQSAPTEWKEGMLTFNEWKKAKELNSAEYQDFIEYQEYLKFINTKK